VPWEPRLPRQWIELSRLFIPDPHSHTTRYDQIFCVLSDLAEDAIDVLTLYYLNLALSSAQSCRRPHEVKLQPHP
jgi:hypothetical protein